MPTDWSPSERLAAMYLYCQLPFGKLHARNPEIITLAARLGRTPSSVAMKLGNFASLDPVQQQRGVSGLKGASRGDREVWAAFEADWAGMVDRSAAIYEDLLREPPTDAPERLDELGPPIFRPAPIGPTTVERQVLARRGQDWFRAALLAGFDGACCVSGVNVDTMLVASHIVRWADDPSLRLNPHNGLLLSAIHDRAFEHGYLTVDERMKVVVADELRRSPNPFLRDAIGASHGVPLRSPRRFAPDPALLARHREERFRG